MSKFQEIREIMAEPLTADEIEKYYGADEDVIDPEYYEHVKRMVEHAKRLPAPLSDDEIEQLSRQEPVNNILQLPAEELTEETKCQ